MKDLKDLLEKLGLPPEAIMAVIVAAAIFVFFLKRFLDRREKQEMARIEDLREYARLQEEALLKAYRLLFEQVDLNKLTQKEFSQVICQADELIMDPFTRYRRNLPDDIRAKIYNDLHSPIAQFKPDPAFPREVTPEAKHTLSQYGSRFLKEIESTLTMIQNHLKGGIL